MGLVDPERVKEARVPRPVMLVYDPAVRSALTMELKLGAPEALPWRTVVVVPRDPNTVGVAPAPPPRTIALAVKRPEEAMVVEPVNPRIPPDVPEAMPVPPFPTPNVPVTAAD